MQRQVPEANSAVEGRERPVLVGAFFEPKPQLVGHFDLALPSQVLKV